MQRVSRWLTALVTPGGPGKTVLYVAASADLDIHTLRAYLAPVPDAMDLKLLVRTAPGSVAAGAAAKPEALDLAHDSWRNRTPSGAPLARSRPISRSRPVRPSTTRWPRRPSRHASRAGPRVARP